jgi:hypothetical protein
MITRTLVALLIVEPVSLFSRERETSAQSANLPRLHLPYGFDAVGSLRGSDDPSFLRWHPYADTVKWTGVDFVNRQSAPQIDDFTLKSRTVRRFHQVSGS